MAIRSSRPGMMIAGGVVFLAIPFLWANQTNTPLNWLGVALAAAVAIQRGLRERTWPDDTEVCVRIGIHTGRTTLAETGYVGIAVHTASRVCSAGHGGQILLSTAAHDALASIKMDGSSAVAFRPLGRYALAGLAEPEAVFQATPDGLRAKFPKLRVTRA